MWLLLLKFNANVPCAKHGKQKKRANNKSLSTSHAISVARKSIRQTIIINYVYDSDFSNYYYYRLRCVTTPTHKNNYNHYQHKPT